MLFIQGQSYLGLSLLLSFDSGTTEQRGGGMMPSLGTEPETAVTKGGQTSSFCLS